MSPRRSANLEASEKHVFYAAPGFADAERLSERYTHDRVAISSIFVRPSAIGPLKDDKKHHVALQICTTAHFCSEPKKVETVNFEALIGRLGGPQTAEVMPEDTLDFFEQEAEDLLRCLNAELGGLKVGLQVRFGSLGIGDLLLSTPVMSPASEPVNKFETLAGWYLL